MPKRTDIKSILVIGAGPIVIGQACEFDYSGVQACKALREEGYRVILINSNPATIMTDPEFADRTYIEPITPEIVEKIIERERPDALLPTLGGDDRFEIFLREWLDVSAVGNFGVGHDRSRVRIDQDDLEPFGAQSLAGLRAGIIEFAGLADDDRAGADDED